MNKKKIAGLFFLLSIFALRTTDAAESPSLEQPSVEELELGKKLFNAKEGLGVKYACIMCHQKDKAIERSKATGLGDKLPDVINKYILGKSKGKFLAKDSQEMKALEAYILYEHSK